VLLDERGKRDPDRTEKSRRTALIIAPEKLDPRSRYKLLIGSVVPRPIAWTSTVSREGVRNLAPFSFFTVASRNPPIGNYKTARA
jgi:flavin reductase (DIM6/NTAB) family NADH-FMN oxidoreductase RutF